VGDRAQARPRYRCAACAGEHPADATRWRCDCGGVLDLAAVGGNRFAAGEIAALSMGEGQVPVVTVTLGSRAVTATVEFASPTLSFKDRGAVVLVAAARALGATQLVADSSGNAGTAIAAYAARARLPCEVFVAASTSPAKLAQMRAHGADVRTVDGTREDVAAAAIERVEATGAFYASHVWNPFFLQGTRSWAAEVVRAIGAAPDTVVLPVGNGTLLLGAAHGFAELREAGTIDRVPRIVAVQAEGCAPVAAAFHAGADTVEPVTPAGTIAEGIAIAAPPRGTQCLAAIRASGGTVVTVRDDDIRRARADLAAQGVYVEPTAAATAAGLVAAGLSDADATVAMPLCGAGIKAPG
jgi:threonine synthase